MIVGRVMGTAVSTVKHESMRGWKLLIVQPYLADGLSADGFPVLAVDSLGAGNGDQVIISSDGKATRTLLQVDATPVRWSVVGLVDPVS